MSPTSVGSVFYYSNGGTPETWTEVTNRLYLDILDSITNRTRILTVNVPNPNNSVDSLFTPFQRVKVTEAVSGRLAYLGRILSTQDTTDNSGNYVLQIIANDYSSELFFQTVDKNYTVTPGADKRSVLIQDILTDWTYSGNLNYNIQASYVNLPAGVDYTRSNQSPAQIIADLAGDDPWDAGATPAGYGFDFLVDDTQTFQYFKRGTRGPNLTIKYGADTSSNVIIPMLPGYTFTPQTNEIITRVTCYGMDQDGNPQTYTAINTTFEATYKIINQQVEYVNGSTMTGAQLLTYVTNKAKADLTTNYGIIWRGQFQIVGYPLYGPSNTLTRVGDLITIDLSNTSLSSSASGNYLVTSVEYSEDPTSSSSFLSTINVMSFQPGAVYSPFDVTSVLQGLRSGASISISSAQICDLVVNSANIASLTANKITTETLGIGQNINTGTEGGANIQLNTSGITGYNSSNIQTFSLNTNGSGQLGVTGSEISWNSSGTISINASLINLSGVVHIGGAAADVNAHMGTTTINGGAITTGTISTTQLNFTPVIGSSIIASINASSEGITIQSAKITIDGYTTFGTGYNPTTKITSGGAAADVNAHMGTTTINGGAITTGTITGNMIYGGTITGVIINQASGGVVINSTGIILTGTNILQFNISGSMYGYIGSNYSGGIHDFHMEAMNGASLNLGTSSTFSISAGGAVGITSSGALTLTCGGGTTVNYYLKIPVGTNCYL